MTEVTGKSNSAYSLLSEKQKEANRIAQRKYKTTDKYRKFRKAYNTDHRRALNKINNIKYRYGLDNEEFESLRLIQNNLCAICNKPETRIFKGKVTNLCVDHNHITKEVRKLLCNRCNTMIGHCNEDIVLLYKMIEYLKNHEGELLL